jgi:cell wall-associated NlpC family hydrolase
MILMHRVSILIILCSVLVFVSGCQTGVRFASNPPAKESYSLNSKAEEKGSQANSQIYYKDTPIIRAAAKWIGTPYCYGGSTTSCTDCSGFVSSVYREFGIELPRTAWDQYFYVTVIDNDMAQPGDLVFFKNNGAIFHVGIYAGNNEMIHASSSRGVIRQTLDDPYFKKNFAGFGRVFN